MRRGVTNVTLTVSLLDCNGVTIFSSDTVKMALITPFCKENLPQIMSLSLPYHFVIRPYKQQQQREHTIVRFYDPCSQACL